METNKEIERLKAMNKRLKCYLDYIADFCRHYNSKIGTEEHLVVLDRKVGEFLNEIRILEEPVNEDIASLLNMSTRIKEEILSCESTRSEQDKKDYDRYMGAVENILAQYEDKEPKMKKVKLLAWFEDGRLIFQEEAACFSEKQLRTIKRVESEDKIIEVEI